MRNLLLILVLANVLYFMWQYFQADDEEETGVAILDEAALGPPMMATDEPPPEVVADVVEGVDEPPDDVAAAEEPAAEDAEGEEETEEPGAPIQLAATVGSSCVTLGPFRASTDADTAQTAYASQGMKTATRRETGQIFVGHWVQIRDVPDKATGDANVATLRNGGIPEAYLVTTDDEGLKISLGVFGNRDGAMRVRGQARALGFAAEITPRNADGIYYFVDVKLPPGRGAGAMVERYGEEKVRMREVSSCPD